MQDVVSTQPLGKPKHVFFEPQPSYKGSVTTEACGRNKVIEFKIEPTIGHCQHIHRLEWYFQ
jgi:hypothetical protein